MGTSNSNRIGLIAFCFIAVIVCFYLGLESVRNPSILGENPPPQILFIALLIFFSTTGGIMVGKPFFKKKNDQ